MSVEATVVKEWSLVGWGVKRYNSSSSEIIFDDMRRNIITESPSACKMRARAKRAEGRISDVGHDLWNKISGADLQLAVDGTVGTNIYSYRIDRDLGKFTSTNRFIPPPPPSFNPPQPAKISSAAAASSEHSPVASRQSLVASRYFWHRIRRLPHSSIVIVVVVVVVVQFLQIDAITVRPNATVIPSANRFQFDSSDRCDPPSEDVHECGQKFSTASHLPRKATPRTEIKQLINGSSATPAARSIAGHRHPPLDCRLSRLENFTKLTIHGHAERSVGSQLSLSWRTFHFQVDSTENSSDPAKARREMTGGRNSKNENDYGNGNGNERKGARGSRSRPSGRSEARVQPSGKQNGATRRDERGSFPKIGYSSKLICAESATTHAESKKPGRATRRHPSNRPTVRNSASTAVDDHSLHSYAGGEAANRGPSHRRDVDVDVLAIATPLHSTPLHSSRRPAIYEIN
ncbi:hypothetical protein V9T40_011776 [Parthenolecanium corni]|uniref:Uncharacterized protein n=1 Tax=Parthenolecanium corni TaxID=536013 RepID=A0AAN9XZU4_9HEMI